MPPAEQPAGTGRAGNRHRGLLALLVVVVVLVSGAAALTRRPGAAGPAAGGGAALDGPAAADRNRAVQALLVARAGALVRGDEVALAATLDPAAHAFGARQRALLVALRAVPVSQWCYQLDPALQHGPEPVLDRRYQDRWWAPGVTLRYALAGFDPAPVVSVQRLTFVQRAAHWYLAADDDFAAAGLDSDRGIWDGGTVSVRRTPTVLVLGHPQSATLMAAVADQLEAAVPRVSRFWGAPWPQRVVALVPASPDEMQALLGPAVDVRQLAAVSTGEVDRAGQGRGERVVLNPVSFPTLTAVGRRFVLAHELTHVASAGAAGPFLPTWLVEGLADESGYQGLSLPLSVTAREVLVALHAGARIPGFPADQEFTGANPALAQTYERSWLAVTWLSKEYGLPAILALYRELGAARSPAAAAAAFPAVLGASSAALAARWSGQVAGQLG